MGFLLDTVPLSVTEMAAYRELLAGATWKAVHGRAYETAMVDVPGAKRSFFLKLPPHSSLHPHVDAGDCRTDHVVMTTNPLCWNYWYDGLTHVEHMEQGQQYTVNRTVLHWSTNDGETDRVHLLLEY